MCSWGFIGYRAQRVPIRKKSAPRFQNLPDSLEKDIAESAKQNGFYPEYAAQLKAVKNALLTSRQPAGIPSTS